MEKKTRIERWRRCRPEYQTDFRQNNQSNEAAASGPASQQNSPASSSAGQQGSPASQQSNPASRLASQNHGPADCFTGRPPRCPSSRPTSITSLAALVIGVIFVVLAGAIFATTTWRIMPDMARVLTILGTAAVCFLASMAADRIFRIHKTANACYLLGCIFLFLTVVAAGYFGMLDRIFVREESRWWRILSLGSLVMEAAMLLGIRRFSDPHYTLVCCLGVSLNMALVLEALECSAQQFVSGMALYSSFLVVVHVAAAEWTARKGNGNTGGTGLGSGTFALLHLCISGWFLLLQCAGESFVNLLYNRSAMDGTVWMNIASLAAVAAAGGLLAWKRSRTDQVQARKPSHTSSLDTDRIWDNGLAQDQVPAPADCRQPGFVQTLAAMIFQVMTMELFHYTAFTAPWPGLGANLDLALLVPAVLVTLLFFLVRKRISFLHTGLGDGLATLVLLWDALFLAGNAGFGFHQLRWQVSAIVGVVLFTSLVREWGKQWEIVRMLLPLPLWYVVVPGYAILSQTLVPQVEMEWLCLAYGCGLMLWDFVRKDAFAPVIALVSVVSVCTMWLAGNRGMEVAWMAAAGVYVLGFARTREYKKQALVGSMVLLTLAFERQPWLVWPEVLRLEMFLLPLAADLYMLNFLWDDHTEVESLQTVGYVLCLGALTIDALMGGEVTDALILEGICLVVFLLSHLAGSRKWMWISGSILVAVVIYMTRDFWLSIAWWVYLLTAGIGLIVFAAVREKRRNREMEEMPPTDSDQ